VNGALSLRTSDGFALALHRNRWMGPASPADLRLLGRILPPVLDVGCGPGRLIRALAERGEAVEKDAMWQYRAQSEMAIPPTVQPSG